MWNFQTKFIPKTSSEFYETLYSLDSAPKSKSQELINKLFDLMYGKKLKLLRRKNQKIVSKFE
jgi:hypothetical protein